MIDQVANTEKQEKIATLTVIRIQARYLQA